MARWVVRGGTVCGGKSRVLREREKREPDRKNGSFKLIAIRHASEGSDGIDAGKAAMERRF